jgi:hypothetical protein
MEHQDLDCQGNTSWGIERASCSLFSWALPGSSASAQAYFFHRSKSTLQEQSYLSNSGSSTQASSAFYPQQS